MKDNFYELSKSINSENSLSYTMEKEKKEDSLNLFEENKKKPPNKINFVNVNESPKPQVLKAPSK